MIFVTKKIIKFFQRYIKQTWCKLPTHIFEHCLWRWHVDANLYCSSCSSSMIFYVLLLQVVCSSVIFYVLLLQVVCSSVIFWVLLLQVVCSSVIFYVLLLQVVCSSVIFYVLLLQVVCSSVIFYVLLLQVVCSSMIFYVLLLQVVCSGWRAASTQAQQSVNVPETVVSTLPSGMRVATESIGTQTCTVSLQGFTCLSVILGQCFYSNTGDSRWLELWSLEVLDLSK